MLLGVGKVPGRDRASRHRKPNIRVAGIKTRRLGKTFQRARVGTSLCQYVPKRRMVMRRHGLEVNGAAEIALRFRKAALTAPDVTQEMERRCWSMGSIRPQHGQRTLRTSRITTRKQAIGLSQDIVWSRIQRAISTTTHARKPRMLSRPHDRSPPFARQATTIRPFRP